MKRKQIARVDLSNPDKPKLVYDVKEFKALLSNFKDGQRVWIQVETYYRKRTVEQNNVLHWYLQEIADETGMEMLDVKEQMAKKYLTVDQLDKNDNIVCDPETGKVMTRVKSTTDLVTIM